MDLQMTLDPVEMLSMSPRTEQAPTPEAPKTSTVRGFALVEAPAGLRSPEHAERAAQRLFRKALAGWAMDLMDLRRRGLDRPGPSVD